MELANKQNAPLDSYIISHHKLRQALGVLGLVLPILLVIIERYFGYANPWQQSISHYFYSKAHVLFVGALCIMGALFCTYSGKWKYESSIANVAGVCAFLVAIFPTGQAGFLPACSSDLTGCLHCSDNLVEKHYESWYMWVHFGSAVVMFLMIALFCWVYFPKPEDHESGEAYFKKKKFRNIVYRGSAIGIVVSLFVCFISWKEDKVLPYNTVFIGETICLWLFGSSWLLKGSYSWKYSRNAFLNMMYRLVR